MKSFILIGLATVIFSACGSPPVVVNKKPPPPARTPIIPEAATIDKQTNVSFSTYSKEWPVNWQWIDPEESHKPSPRDISRGVLSVQVPSGKNLYGDNRTAPRFVKALNGDFQIETRVKFLPKENYQGAGLLIYKDDTNYIRFERAYGGVGGGGEGIRIDVRQGDQYTPLVTPNDIQNDAGEIDMKIMRSGRIFTMFWRIDEESEWREAGEYESDYPDTILAGVVACNTAREITAEFAYIRLLPGIRR